MQNHSEIEKLRRDKTNMWYIIEMASLVPVCKSMSRKLDKVTVLRKVAQHIKTIRGSTNSYTEGHYKPSWLSDDDVKNVALQGADGFLFVESCDCGRILFMSESVQQTLNYIQGDILGQSWFDILYSKDIAKVKEQLSLSDPCSKERLIDAKSSRSDAAAERRIFAAPEQAVSRCSSLLILSDEMQDAGYRQRGGRHHDGRPATLKGAQLRPLVHSVIHCTGCYFKPWACVRQAQFARRRPSGRQRRLRRLSKHMIA
ncbi:hypothetical protein HPB51_021973 [Rhipicephalus microplus]|uniref:Uncharacterized protein n=1 Tax=Rhipicephalus microplus TaxID=6941 RepID=A0A9J6EQ56_RHIMP|nr:hypothetical protein HPB51_021973 [Rhipicephalus microplus]